MLRVWRFAALLLVTGSAGCGLGTGGGGGGAPYPGGRSHLKFGGVVRFHHKISAKDGWPLGMWEYFADNYDPSRPPVLMTAGFLESGYAYDLPMRPDLSLARFLALRGWHVWVLDFRGSGTSHVQPILTPSSVPMDGWRFNVDDYIHHDLPAAIDFVRQFTGKPQVLLVGHSIGGLAAYGYVQTQDAEKVRGIVTLGGVGIGGGSGNGTVFSPLFGLLGFLAPLVPNGVIFPLHFAALGVVVGPDWLYQFVAGFLQSQFGQMYWNPANMDPEVVELAFVHALANTSTTVIKQFLLWEQLGEVTNFGPNPDAWLGNILEQLGQALFGSGSESPATSPFYDRAGAYSYSDHLGDVQVPVLTIAGGHDKVVPRENVVVVFHALGSSDKQYVELSEEFGASADYGHLDMLLGPKAPQEVFPVIHEWLLAHR